MTRDRENARRLQATIEDAIKIAPAPSRAQVSRTRSRLLAAGLVASVVAVGLTGGVHLNGRPTTLVYGTLLGWAAIAMAGAWLAIGRRGAMLGPPTRLLIACAAAMGPVLLAWYALLEHLLGAAGEAAVPVSMHVTCFAITLAYAAGPLAAVGATYRAIDPVHPRATGALLFAAIGALGGALIVLHCWVGELAHVALGHVLPLVGLAAAGALVGDRLFGTTSLPGRGRLG